MSEPCFCTNCGGALARVRTASLHRPHYECACCSAVYVEGGRFGVFLCENPRSHVIRDYGKVPKAVKARAKGVTSGKRR
jgi:hypothetical protein